jgi:two-component system cell cycle response regulator DivK
VRQALSAPKQTLVLIFLNGCGPSALLRGRDWQPVERTPTFLQQEQWPSMNQTRVLIVDDNEMFIEMAKFILTAAAYTVDTAPDARQALLQIPVFLPDLILIDIQMPVMDGIELTRQLKADLATKHIVIVAFTAYALKGNGTYFVSHA